MSAPFLLRAVLALLDRITETLRVIGEGFLDAGALDPYRLALGMNGPTPRQNGRTMAEISNKLSGASC